MELYWLSKNAQLKLQCYNYRLVWALADLLLSDYCTKSPQIGLGDLPMPTFTFTALF